MRTFLVGVIALLPGLLTTPSPGSAQHNETDPPRLVVTPILGLRTPFISGRETVIVAPGDLIPGVVRLESDRPTGGTAGLELDLRLGGRLGLTGAFLYATPDDMVLTQQIDRGAISELHVQGPSVQMIRAGLSYLLPPIPGADYNPLGYIYAGPALLRRDYGGTLLRTGDRWAESWAAAFGYRALFPVGSPSLMLQITLEDYVSFWRDDEATERFQRLLDLPPGTLLGGDLGYDRPHVLILHVGAALRL